MSSSRSATADDFVYETWPGRVVFGPGRVDSVAEEIDRLGVGRVFLVAREMPAADRLEQLLDGRLAGRWSEIAQHVPVEIAERARAAVDDCGADCVLSVGGGSATGLAKAIALSHGVPVVAVPTTYAGSEMTTIYGLTGGEHKQTGRDPRVRPVLVIYDAELTTGLPPEVTGPSAFNALAHCVAALGSSNADPVSSALALEGVRHVHDSLPRVMTHPDDLAARSDLQLGVFLAGSALAGTGTGLHHTICHVLGGMLNLVHADTHSVVLPHVVALNAPGLPREMDRLAAALGDGGGDPARLLWDLAVRTGVATDLAGLGVRPEYLREVAERVVGTPNPVPVTADDVEALLGRACAGQRPLPVGAAG